MSTANKITLVNNRVERAKSLLLSQFKDKPNINALVDALVSELQELENVINDLQTVRTLEGAYGWWLDQIGNDVDVSRGNYDDNDYKTAIKIAMAKKSASASIDDILRITSLITADTEAQVNNPHRYLIELYSYFFCVSDSPDGLEALASLFPLNSRALLVKHEVKPFKFNTAGRGFGSGSKLNSILLYKTGISEDPRFVSLPTQEYIPPITSSPTVKTKPYIYGTAEVGNVLTLVQGVFDGDDPITITKQWLRDGVDISGATGNTYTLVAGDEGKGFQVKVTATNAYGSVVTYSNTISISATIPPVNTLKDGLGLRDFYTSTLSSPPSSVTNTTTITIKSDGTVAYIDNGATDSTDQWLTTTGAGLGADYRFTYSVVLGTEFPLYNQNAVYPLSSDIVLSMAVTSVNSVIKDGTYDITIYKASDNTIIRTKRIYVSSEIASN